MCFMADFAKWLLERRQASEQLSAEGNLFLMPDWAQTFSLWMPRKRVLGRLCPSINFDQIFTVHLMVSLVSHFCIFPSQNWNSWGQFMFPLVGLEPCLSQ